MWELVSRLVKFAAGPLRGLVSWRFEAAPEGLIGASWRLLRAPERPWAAPGASGLLLGAFLKRPRRPGRASLGHRNLPRLADLTSGQIKKSSKGSFID